MRQNTTHNDTPFVHQLFRGTAERWPERTAMVRGDDLVDYSQLERRSSRLAKSLVDSGVGSGSPVGVVTRDPFDVVTSLLGILKAGCAFVPLDPSLPEKRLRSMIALAELDKFVVCSELAEVTGELTEGRASLVLNLDDVSAAGPPVSAPEVGVSGDSLAYIYFTSGSTGKPKAIAGRLRSIDHFIRWEIETLGLDESCRVSQLSAPTFDAFLRDVFVPLCTGGALCVLENRELVLDSKRLVEWIDRQGITLVHCVPSLFRSLISAGLNAHHLAALKYVLLSGEPLLPADVGRWTDVFGERIQLVNLYGPSETTMTKLYYFVSAADKDKRTVPIGKPMSGAQALAIDERGEVCGPGKIGEILIRTPFRSLGYYNQPELTEKVFVPNPFSDNPNDIVYKTGDLGRLLRDGNFEFMGRKDHQVKIRGVRIELGEIEGLLHGHEAIDDAVVVSREDVTGTKYLCAYVVLHGGGSLEQVRSSLASELPEWMQPSVFVELEGLPRTVSGKVDRRALPAPSRASTGVFKPPRTPFESRLAATFCELLGLDRVSIEDSFFQLGGHSLLATQLLARIRAEFRVEIPLRALFGAPTVSGLALIVAQMQAEQEDQEEIARILKEIRELPEDVLESSLAQQAEESGAPAERRRETA